MSLDHLPYSQRAFVGPRLSLLVLSRAGAGEYAPDVPHVVISLTDPDAPDAQLAPSPARRAVLRLKFHDTGDYGQPLRGQSVMTADHARAILSFIQEHQPHVQMIVCHCEAGASRSPAVAAALSRLLQGEDGHFFAYYQPNRWVYRTLLQTAEADGWAAPTSL